MKKLLCPKCNAELSAINCYVEETNELEIRIGEDGVPYVDTGKSYTVDSCIKTHCCRVAIIGFEDVFGEIEFC